MDMQPNPVWMKSNEIVNYRWSFYYFLLLIYLADTNLHYKLSIISRENRYYIYRIHIQKQPSFIEFTLYDLPLRWMLYLQYDEILMFHV